LATAITNRDDAPAGHPNTSVDLDVNFNGTTLVAHPKLALVGPGDIVGLDSRVVVRAWPKADENDAEFGNLALIEFDQADLPWRYTPSTETTSHRLRPWINLIVVEEDGVTVQPPTPTIKQARITVDPHTLPNLNESWAWAHTQFEGAKTDATAAAARIKAKSGLFASRIICPKVLESNKRYLACLVPTFLRGQRIGTGQDPTDIDALKLAWDNSDNSVDLPIYYSWRFQTGSTGSFELLARLIQAAKVPRGLGRRKMDVRSPGLGLPQATPSTLDAEGALQSPEAGGPSPWSDTDRTNWVSHLKDFLNTPTFNGQRVVAPPLYARWYAAQDKLDETAGQNPPWFFTLNSDPRNRVAGGLGTLVVQKEQQALMASAWKQVGELDAINDRLRVLQLGRAALSRMFERHVLTGFTDDFWTMTASVHAFVQCGTTTVCGRFRLSPVDPWVFDPAWRRIARPLGRAGRRQGQPALGSSVDSKLIDRLNQGECPAPEPPVPIGLFTRELALGDLVLRGITQADIDKLRTLALELRTFWGLVIIYVGRKLLVEQNGECWWHALRLIRFGMVLLRDDGDIDRRTGWTNGTLTCDKLNAAPKAPNFAPSLNLPPIIPLPGLLGGGPDTPDAIAFRQALCRTPGITGPVDGHPTPPPLAPQPIESCRLQLRIELHPTKTIETRFLKLLKLAAAFTSKWNPLDKLQPIFGAPEYEQPMYKPLSEISQDWILPGLNEVGRNTAGLAVTNQRFIEAYMAGLNDEMTRELLWNEFPTDQRGTYFRQFWDLAGVIPAPGTDPNTLRDIHVLAKWSPTSDLGGNSPRPPVTGGGERLVLLLRAQLIQRYPNVIVYARRAAFTTPGNGHQLDTDEKHPIFFGNLSPDVAFYGFDLTAPQVRGSSSDPGWFFILQEQPGEPKFEPRVDENTVLTSGNLSPPPKTTSAENAKFTFRRPFRLGIHGSALLPPD
jgi:hypothetical protein